MKKKVLAAMGLAIACMLSGCTGGAAKSETVADVKENTKTDAGAVAYPEDDITLVIPYDAGGGNDLVGRIIAKVAMDGGYFNGHNLIVENMPGGGGAIGQAHVANTAPRDGYTLMCYTGSTVSNPILKDVPFTIDDFKIIVWPNMDPYVLVTNPNAPYDDIPGLVEYMKNNKLLITDSGFGTGSHIRTLEWTEKLEAATGVKIDYDSIHVDSGSMQATEIMGEHADITALSIGECADMIKEGNLKALGVFLDERSEALPDVPTFAEQGYEGFVDVSLRTIACHKDVPEDIYNYLVEEMTKLCSSEEFINAMKDASLLPVCKNAEEAQEFINTRIELYEKVKDTIKAGQ